MSPWLAAAIASLTITNYDGTHAGEYYSQIWGWSKVGSASDGVEHLTSLHNDLGGMRVVTGWIEHLDTHDKQFNMQAGLGNGTTGLFLTMAGDNTRKIAIWVWCPIETPNGTYTGTFPFIDARCD